MSGYNADEQLRNRPLGVDELRNLRADDIKAIARRRSQRDHFLSRLTATANHFTTQVQDLQLQVDELRLERRQLNQTSTLSPIESIKYVPADALIELVRDVEIKRRLEQIRDTNTMLAGEVARLRALNISADDTNAATLSELVQQLRSENEISARAMELLHDALAAGTPSGVEPSEPDNSNAGDVSGTSAGDSLADVFATEADESTTTAPAIPSLPSARPSADDPLPSPPELIVETEPEPDPMERTAA